MDVTIGHAANWFALLLVLVLSTHAVAFCGWRCCWAVTTKLRPIFINESLGIICSRSNHLVSWFLARWYAPLQLQWYGLAMIQSETTLFSRNIIIFYLFYVKLVSLNNIIAFKRIWCWLCLFIVHNLYGSFFLHHLWFKVRFEMYLRTLKNRTQGFFCYRIL